MAMAASGALAAGAGIAFIFFGGRSLGGAGAAAVVWCHDVATAVEVAAAYGPGQRLGDEGEGDEAGEEVTHV